MRFRPVFAWPLCMALALSTGIITPAKAGGHTGDVIAGVALGVLGASIAHHHHSHGAPYQNHPSLTPEENAVGLCMHRTKTAMTNQGYYAVDFVKTLSYEANADSINLIDLEVARSANSNDARSTIKAHCAIQNDEVVNFRYSNY